jgi:hypothetical protein
MDVQLKKKEKDDSEFLFRLFEELKIAELNIASWPELMKNQLVAMQYNAFEKMIKNEYPNSEDYLVVFNFQKAGRLQLNDDNEVLKILNISLLPAFQNLGIGSKIIKDIIINAGVKNKLVYLEVDKANPVFSLYKKLGFTVYAQDELKYYMKYFPHTNCS